MYLSEVIFTILAFLVTIVGIVSATSSYLEQRKRQGALRTKLDKAEQEASTSDKAKPAWDVASLNLQAYLDRNLAQVRQIFWISVIAMIAGFVLVFWAAMRSLTDPSQTTATYVAATSGVITEFIGATFLFIYRSTLTQASSYMQTLERINRVGMAVQILDSIAENDELKNQTKSELVKLLMSVAKGN
jgi:cytochrome c biogenesis protein CcdA